MRQGSGRLIDGGGGPTAIVCVIVMAVIIGLVSLIVNMSDFLDGVRPIGSLGSGMYGTWQEPLPQVHFSAAGQRSGVGDITIRVAVSAGDSGGFGNLV